MAIAKATERHFDTGTRPAGTRRERCHGFVRGPCSDVSPLGRLGKSGSDEGLPPKRQCVG